MKLPGRLRAFIRDRRGQSLIEYTLLIAVLALASAALLIPTGQSVRGVWNSANNTIATGDNPTPDDAAPATDPSSSAEPPASEPAPAPAPADGGGGDHNYDGHHDDGWRH